MLKTHSCGELRPSDEGEVVSLAGWVHRRRDHGGLIFIDLRDHTGIVQLVVNPERSPEAAKVAHGIRSEFVVRAKGEVVRRAPEAVNKNIPTGEVEIQVDELEIVARSEPLPFQLDDEGVEEPLRLKYRYLDLRRDRMQRNMRLSATVISAIRRSMEEQGFIDVWTPTMTLGTPEGARDFLVPVRLQPGKFFALAQSPQLFKQLFMVGGLDRYYQIATCWRDEDLRADRQFEFRQLDLELAFPTREEVLDVLERVVVVSFEALGETPPPRPFPRMAYAEAMLRYGSDKPDVRLGMELVDLGSAVAGTDLRVFTDALAAGGAIRGLVAPGCAGFSRRQTDALTDLAIRHGAGGLVHLAVESDGSLKGPIARHLPPATQQRVIEVSGAGPGDLILAVADADGHRGAQALGRVRVDLGAQLRLGQPGVLSYVWVHRFPMFKWDAEGNRWDATHNPFSAPVWEEADDMERDPAAIHAQQYDLALNGWELGGGSIRIHRRDLLERAFALMGHTIEGMRDQFGALLDALEFGAPPHGGIAIGLDRWTALLADQDNIREVMAFPKTQSGSDLMLGAPSPIAPEQLAELGLRLADQSPEDS